MNLNIQHDKEVKRFFAIVDGKEARLDYGISPDGKTLDYRSTFVPSELRGQQIGDKLVKFALDYARNNHFKVLPSCPFVKRIIEHNAEYKSIAVGME
jgi:predicted GNAT family acetyltransferase